MLKCPLSVLKHEQDTGWSQKEIALKYKDFYSGARPDLMSTKVPFDEQEGL